MAGAEEVLGRGYPSRRVLRLVGDKWTPVVLYCLSGGSAPGFGELHRRIPGISRKMPAQVLQRLERDGLAHRTVRPSVPPRTEYRLTPLGERLREPIAGLCRWAAEHPDVLDAIEANRLAAKRDQRR